MRSPFLRRCARQYYCAGFVLFGSLGITFHLSIPSGKQPSGKQLKLQSQAYYATTQMLNLPVMPSSAAMIKQGAVLDKQKIAIFYNTFLRKDGKPGEKERGNRIIKEQLDMIDRQPLLADATFYYSRFGALDIDWPGCGNRTCIEIAAQPAGDEAVTLQRLHEYCVKNPLDRAIYIHSKGTNTATRSNEVLRNVLMKAVMSTECVDMATSGNSTCNSTCSAQLAALPFTAYVGNMWVAECAYVKKLIPPKDYEPAKQKIHKDLLNATKRIGNSRFFEVNLDNGTMSFKLKETALWQINRESWIGVARYAMEHWLGSHPDLKPCDVFSQSDPGTPKIGYRAARLSVTALVPRLQVSMKGAFAEGGFQPWFMQEGKLYEYKALYSKVPDNSSWFYRYFNTPI